MATPFTLGVLAEFCPPAWHAAEGRLDGGDWFDGRAFIDMVQRFEAAGLDFVFFLDTTSVRRDQNDSMDPYLAAGSTAPAHDPLPLLSLIAGHTEHIGLIGTATTTYYPPYLLARLFTTLDHISRGRIGWNIVTNFEEADAKNFGGEVLAAGDERYDRADEYVEVAKELWAAWEPDALVRDPERDVYIDPAKVHTVNHAGKYFQVKGPLNTLHSPQGVPVLAQAGASERGRDFSAKNAELTFVWTDDGNFGRLRAHREDLRRRVASFGRDPDELQVIYPANITYTDEPWDPSQGVTLTEHQFRFATLWLSQSMDLDLTQFPLDEPFPLDIEPRGVRSMFHAVLDMAREGKTLREAIVAMRYSAGDTSLYGTPEQIAEKMIRFIDEVGGDGFMINGTGQYSDEFIRKTTDELVPLLRDAGVLRGEYRDGETLRQRLFGRR